MLYFHFLYTFNDLESFISVFLLMLQHILCIVSLAVIEYCLFVVIMTKIFQLILFVVFVLIFHCT